MSKNYVKTDFDPNEQFDYLNPPRHFKSVTDRSIRRLRSRSVKSTLAQYKRGSIPSIAIRAMLEGINGDFNIAYVQVDGDRDARRANLQNAYSDGLADLKVRLMRFKAAVNAHDLLFEKYANALEKATGERPDESLKYGLDEVRKLEKEYEKLRKGEE